MTKFRTALLAVTVALTVAGGAGAGTHVDAKSPTGTSITKVNTAKSGDSWCC